MPLELYLRGATWWVRGTVEVNGHRIGPYVRQSTKLARRDAAEAWAARYEQTEIRRHFLGEAEVLTFADLVPGYPVKARDVKALMRIVEAIGEVPVNQITPQMLRALGPKLYPMASADTWWRHVVTPARAVINHGHDAGRCGYIRVLPYKETERIDQDARRGKQSRIERVPMTRAWVDTFCTAADPYNAAMCRFMFETAARAGQATALEPGHLDLENRQVWLAAQKGHPAQWVKISPEMAEQLAALPPRIPVDPKYKGEHRPRVFGYASKSSYRQRWKTICRAAGIPYLSAHSARHGFYTTLRLKARLDPISVARAGRWKDASLPDRVYAHPEDDQAEMRQVIRTGIVQEISEKSGKQRK